MVQTGCKVRLIYVNPLQDFSYSKLLQLKRAFLITENLTPWILIWWVKLWNPSTRELILNGTSQEPSKFPEPHGPKYLQRCLVQLPRHARLPQASVVILLPLSAFYSWQSRKLLSRSVRHKMVLIIPQTPPCERKVSRVQDRVSPRCRLVCVRAPDGDVRQKEKDCRLFWYQRSCLFL